MGESRLRFDREMWRVCAKKRETNPGATEAGHRQTSGNRGEKGHSGGNMHFYWTAGERSKRCLLSESVGK